MDNEHGGVDEHVRAEGKLDKAEGAIRKALDDLKDVSRHLKERIVGEKKRHELPADDTDATDVTDVARSAEVIDHPNSLNTQ
jgi:hypothetical protein